MKEFYSATSKSSWATGGGDSSASWSEKGVVVLGEGLTLDFLAVGTRLAIAFTLSVTSTGTGAFSTVTFAVIITVAHILHLTIAVDRTPGSIAIAAVIVAVTTVVLARRVAIATATARRLATTGAARGAVAVTTVTATITATVPGAIAAGVEAPRSGWWSASPLWIVSHGARMLFGKHIIYLNLQEVVATDALVVHLVIGIIGIASVLVFDKSKPGWVSWRDFDTWEGILTVGWMLSAAQECRNARGGRIFGG